MKFLTRHLSRCLVAGLVALLPIGGTALMVGYLEASLAEWWLAEQDFYFVGLGLVLAVATIYLIGLVITTFVGRWVWRGCDRVIENLPGVGQLYQTLKQIAGYGQGADAMFREVVLVSNHQTGGEQLGLVTNEVPDGEGGVKQIVFLPGSPNPTTGQLVLMRAQDLKKTSIPVSDAMKALVSVGKTDLAV